MSKKSRKRNKRILAILGVGAAAAMAAKKKRDAVISDGDANDNANKTTTSFKKASIADVSNTAKKDTATKDTAKKDTGRKKSMAETSTVPKKRTGITVYGDGSIKAKDKGSGNFVDYANKEKYSTRGDTKAPGASGGKINSGVSTARGSSTFNDKIKANNQNLKSGGRAGYKSGGSSVKKSMGKALRGGGKVMR